MQHATGNFTGAGDVNIFTQHWLPDDPPRAVILLAHGYAEHSGRYDHVAAHLVDHGYAVYALDHRGHGKSGGKRTYIKDMDTYVTDLRTYFEQVRAAHPDLPVILYGHSMGSIIALLFAERWQQDLAALITTGTALKAAAGSLMIALVKLLSMLPIDARIVPGVPAEAISRDPQVVERYVNDPLVDTRPLNLNMAAAMARGTKRAAGALLALRLPYLALHGTGDMITLPEGAETIRKRSGSADTTVKLYEGVYHEVHNAPEKEQVLSDITAWLDERF